MAPYTLGDSVLRENRRVELAHRLLSHGVRTALIVRRLTGITRVIGSRPCASDSASPVERALGGPPFVL